MWSTYNFVVCFYASQDVWKTDNFYELLTYIGNLKFKCQAFFSLVRAVAAEVCEELYSPVPPHADLALNGVEVFMNASGSHHQLRKLDIRLRAIIGATHTRGGVYMYSNLQGCDGSRLYYGT